MNTQSLLSPTVATLAIIRNNRGSRPGADIRHVAVFLASTTSCGNHQFQIHEQSFPGSADGKDVTEWLASIIPPGADMALRPSGDMDDPRVSSEGAAPTTVRSPWWPIADMAWLRQRFGNDPRIWTLDLSDTDIAKTAETMDLPFAVPGAPWQQRAVHAASEAQTIWFHLLMLTCEDDEIARGIAAWEAWAWGDLVRPIAS